MAEGSAFVYLSLLTLAVVLTCKTFTAPPVTTAWGGCAIGCPIGLSQAPLTELEVFQFQVLPFDLSMSARTFTQVVSAALGALSVTGFRNPAIQYLNGRPFD